MLGLPMALQGNFDFWTCNWPNSARRHDIGHQIQIGQPNLHFLAMFARRCNIHYYHANYEQNISSVNREICLMPFRNVHYPANALILSMSGRLNWEKEITMIWHHSSYYRGQFSVPLRAKKSVSYPIWPESRILHCKVLSKYFSEARAQARNARFWKRPQPEWPESFPTRCVTRLSHDLSPM